MPMSISSRRLPAKPMLAALAVLAALALGACGDSHTKVTGGTYAGESGANAPYLNVGPLIYEVQLSRELNAFNNEDAGYLQGLAPSQSKIEAGKEWFGVFLQVYNNSNTPEPSASARSMAITDTQGLLYRPTIPASTNPFAYTATYVPAKGRLPELNTIAASGPTQGLLLLYKIKLISLDNRPLKLHIVDPLDHSQTATAELDV
jgi:hypothetical protein